MRYRSVDCCNNECPSSQNNTCVLSHPKCVDRIEVEPQIITRNDGLTVQ